MNLTYVLNSAWSLSCRSSLRKLDAATHNVAAAQSRILQDILSANAETNFGRQFGFSSITSIDGFRQSVPTAGYESFRPWIDQIASGRPNVLTRERVLLLEPTSGSVGGRNLIPYTATLRRQFRNGIDAWIADLFQHRPALLRGRSYWSVSPATDQQKRTEGGLRIGFDDDTEYLGAAARFAARRVLAVQSSDMQGVNVEFTLRETLLHLLAAPDLTLISVWSPTFLISLLQHLDESRHWLRENLDRCIPGYHRSIIADVLSSHGSITEKVAKLWPELRLVSCWCDGPSNGFADELQRMLEGIEIQPKGLLSTEAFISLPMFDQAGSALSLRSHFFEFEPVDQPSSCTLLAHELKPRQRYRVIVTTAGGLYRYQTGDVVSVEGFRHQCPLIRFVGREGNISDLVGEKLSDAFVSVALSNTMQHHRLAPTFACLAPVQSRVPHYQLRLDLPARLDQPIDELLKTLNQELSQNPYYEHAIRIGQLGPLESSLSSNGDHWTAFETRCLNEGKRRGDIKPIALDCRNLHNDS